VSAPPPGVTSNCVSSAGVLACRLKEDSKNVDIDKLAEELKKGKARLDELRLRGELLKMELRDKKDDTLTSLDRAYGEAKVKFEKMREAAGEERERLGAGCQAAWEAFQKAYKDATAD